MAKKAQQAGVASDLSGPFRQHGRTLRDTIRKLPAPVVTVYLGAQGIARNHIPFGYRPDSSPGNLLSQCRACHYSRRPSGLEPQLGVEGEGAAVERILEQTDTGHFLLRCSVDDGLHEAFADAVVLLFGVNG